MNGQTGKTAGSVPISRKKLGILSFIVSLAVGAIAMLASGSMAHETVDSDFFADWIHRFLLWGGVCCVFGKEGVRPGRPPQSLFGYWTANARHGFSPSLSIGSDGADHEKNFGKTPQEYADDFYDSKDFGSGDDYGAFKTAIETAVRMIEQDKTVENNVQASPPAVSMPMEKRLIFSVLALAKDLDILQPTNQVRAELMAAAGADFEISD